MTISAAGIAFIKKWEDCRLTAYQDSAGVWTIGWGHTGGVTEGMTITQEEADALLVSDLQTAEAAVAAYDSIYHWSQNEFDALTSFAFNLGGGAISQVTADGTRTKAEIASKMLEYTHAGGEELPGLVERRKQESAMFTDGTYPPGEGGGDDTELLLKFADLVSRRIRFNVMPWLERWLEDIT